MKMAKTKPEKEQILEDIDTTIYDVHQSPKIEIGDPLLNFPSTEAKYILADDYVNPEELQDRKTEQIKEEYKFDETKDGFDEEKIPPKLEYFFRGDNDNALLTCNFLSLSEDDSELYLFCARTWDKI